MDLEIQPIEIFETISLIEEIKAPKPKKKTKTKKERKKKTKKPKKVVLKPILEDEYNERMRYIKRRLFHCNDEEKKKIYNAHIQKLNKRELIKL